VSPSPTPENQLARKERRAQLDYVIGVLAAPVETE
jgi:hypothetical protein